ncbi:MAG: hypothetical protein WC637_12455, partial [Victivallales bacterium]|jgi:50S ribosomal subunit-associated GTPase HflX
MNPDGIFISAKTGLGIDSLLAAIAHKTRDRSEVVKLRIPPARHDVVSLAYKYGKVLSSLYQEDGILDLAVSIPKSYRRNLEEFIVE